MFGFPNIIGVEALVVRVLLILLYAIGSTRYICLKIVLFLMMVEII